MYRVIVDGVLFSTGITNNVRNLFITCNGLNDMPDAIINRKLIRHLALYISIKWKIGKQLREYQIM